MHVPWFSTFTLFTEVLVTAAVLYTFYSGYKKDKFPTLIISLALIYETIFNIAYMASRVSADKLAKHLSGFVVVLAALHGILSLLMFVALIVFMSLAWHQYEKKHNYFKKHKIIMWVFLFFWLVSVFSGAAFYLFMYLIKL
jgi:cyanate permease